MSRQKADLARVSLNQLSTLTGKTYRTLKKVLADVPPASEESGTFFYSPVEVLPIIYGVVRQEQDGAAEIGDGILDPVREKARLDKLRGDKVQIEIDVLREKLIPAERVELQWSKMAAAFRSKILNLPAKISPRLCAVKEIKEVEKILKAECNEALKELSEYDGGSDRTRARSQSS